MAIAVHVLGNARFFLRTFESDEKEQLIATLERELPSKPFRPIPGTDPPLYAYLLSNGLLAVFRPMEPEELRDAPLAPGTTQAFEVVDLLADPMQRLLSSLLAGGPNLPLLAAPERRSGNERRTTLERRREPRDVSIERRRAERRSGHDRRQVG